MPKAPDFAARANGDQLSQWQHCCGSRTFFVKQRRSFSACSRLLHRRSYSHRWPFFLVAEFDTPRSWSFYQR